MGDNSKNSPILVHGCTNPKSRKIKGPVRSLVLRRLIAGYGYGEISKEIKNKFSIVVMPTTIQGFAIRSAPILGTLAERELGAILHQGLSAKGTRIRALFAHVTDLDEAIAGHRSQTKHLHQRWRVDSTLVSLFKERRQALEAIRQEVEPYRTVSVSHAHTVKVSGEVRVKRAVEYAREVLDTLDEDSVRTLTEAIQAADANKLAST